MPHSQSPGNESQHLGERQDSGAGSGGNRGCISGDTLTRVQQLCARPSCVTFISGNWGPGGGWMGTRCTFCSILLYA